MSKDVFSEIHTQTKHAHSHKKHTYAHTHTPSQPPTHTHIQTHTHIRIDTDTHMSGAGKPKHQLAYNAEKRATPIHTELHMTTLMQIHRQTQTFKSVFLVHSLHCDIGTLSHTEFYKGSASLK